MSYNMQTAVSKIVLSNADLVKYIIAPYLNNNDMRNFYSCNRLLRSLLKPQSIVEIDVYHSYKYLLDAQYRTRINTTIGVNRLSINFPIYTGCGLEDKIEEQIIRPYLYSKGYSDSYIIRNQLARAVLNFDKQFVDITVLKDVRELTLVGKKRNAIDVSSLGGIHTLCLSGCNKLIGITALGRVHTLNLSCTNVTDEDLKALGQVHTLNLTLTKITDVSSLGKVHTLKIAKTNVTDVSMLGAAHTLDLSYTKVTDVSALGTVYHLNLYKTEVSDVSALGNVRILDISYTYVTDVSMLGGAYSLTLIDTRIRNVSMLGRVHNLDVSRTDVIDVSALSNVEVLSLSHTKVTDVSMLGNVYYLNISNTPVSDFSTLVNVRRLFVANTRITDISPFVGASCLDIRRTRVKKIPTTLCNLEDLWLYDARYLKVIPALPKLQRISVKSDDYDKFIFPDNVQILRCNYK